MELNGALSNRQATDEVRELVELCSRIRREAPTPTAPREPVAVLRRPMMVTEIAEQVLRRDGGPMRLAARFAGCEQLAGVEVSYDSLRSALSEGAKPRGRFVRLGYGLYRLQERR